MQYEKEVDKSKGLHFVVRNLETENSSLQQKLDLMSEEQGGIKQVKQYSCSKLSCTVVPRTSNDLNFERSRLQTLNSFTISKDVTV